MCFQLVAVSCPGEDNLSRLINSIRTRVVIGHVSCFCLGYWVKQGGRDEEKYHVKEQHL